MLFDFIDAKISIKCNVVYGLECGLFQIIVSEIALWAFGDERQKTIRAFCRQCKIPQVLRRIIRYIGMLFISQHIFF